jgi:hypothetical protein
MNDRLFSIPETLPSKSIDNLGDEVSLCLDRYCEDYSDALHIDDVIRKELACQLERNLRLQIESNRYIHLGPKIGEGKQGAVYAVEGSEDLCIKIGRNARSAKQFRREIIGATIFSELDVSFPEVLAHDEHGQWILKRRWHASKNAAPAVLYRCNRNLSPLQIATLKECVDKFFIHGLCPDFMPSNVVFCDSTIAFYESSLWSLERQKEWTFQRCFVPAWLPSGPNEAKLDGLPPYKISPKMYRSLQEDWGGKDTNSAWLQEFGDFQPLSTDWWLVY